MKKSYYTKEEVLQMVREADEHLTAEQALKKAQDIHRALNTIDVSWRRSNKRFYGHVVSSEIYIEKEYE